MIIDHIGVAVPSIERGLQDWEALFGYRQISPVVENTRQKVRVVFLAKANSIPIKLVEPSGPDSPISRFTGKGGGLHHFCFRCDNLDEAISSMKQAGARFLVAPQPGEAFGNHNVAFCLTPGNLNIELIDTDQKVTLAPLQESMGSSA